MKNVKAGGFNGVSPNVIKALEGDNLNQVFNFITDFWSGHIDIDIPEWKDGQYVPVSKGYKGLGVPNK